jgi:hypothetical protein
MLTRSKNPVGNATVMKGNIAPGLHMNLGCHALHKSQPALPSIAVSKNSNVAYSLDSLSLSSHNIITPSNPKKSLNIYSRRLPSRYINFSNNK